MDKPHECENCTALERRVAELEAEAQQAKDLALRALARLENMKNRVIRAVNEKD